MRKRFVPQTYRRELFVRLNSLHQTTLSVKQYIKEFERLTMACHIQEEDKQKIARFLVGLKKSITNIVELQQYVTFDDVCILASKIERQQNEPRFQKPLWFNKPAASLDASSSTPPTSTTDLASDKLKATEPSTTSTTDPSNATIKAKKPQCFRCQGLGHIARNCPNTTLTTREELICYLE
ncbi:hypothetical protein BVRB_001790 [Beta vulgaris subsp. vulgaris]|uniref:CCHC-type domain-containing protein n=1 Tax=Beta vulgaris subsp. vulgaris TaxID=3555 RepID=A0A0J8B866_BETVV|nr:hypothetical protein BVRB_001790 [Beta vulgaris subsp. vulgaris]